MKKKEIPGLVVMIKLYLPLDVFQGLRRKDEISDFSTDLPKLFNKGKLYCCSLCYGPIKSKEDILKYGMGSTVLKTPQSTLEAITYIASLILMIIITAAIAAFVTAIALLFL